jgi:hypothetical protein
MVEDNTGEAGRGYETRDLNLKGIAVFVVALVITLVAVHLVVIQTLGFYIRHEARPAALSSVQAPSGAPPGPGLLVDAPKRLGEMLAQEDQTLNSTGWVDRNKGIVRIPIARAMDLVVERGLPTRVTGAQQTDQGERVQ